MNEGERGGGATQTASKNHFWREKTNHPSLLFTIFLVIITSNWWWTPGWWWSLPGLWSVTQEPTVQSSAERKNADSKETTSQMMMQRRRNGGRRLQLVVVSNFVLIKEWIQWFSWLSADLCNNISFKLLLYEQAVMLWYTKSVCVWRTNEPFIPLVVVLWIMEKERRRSCYKRRSPQEDPGSSHPIFASVFLSPFSLLKYRINHTTRGRNLDLRSG